MMTATDQHFRNGHPGTVTLWRAAEEIVRRIGPDRHAGRPAERGR